MAYGVRSILFELVLQSIFAATDGLAQPIPPCPGTGKSGHAQWSSLSLRIHCLHIRLTPQTPVDRLHALPIDLKLLSAYLRIKISRLSVWYFASPSNFLCVANIT